MEINGRNVVAVEEKYVCNGALAVKLYSRTGELYATLTVNLPESNNLEYGYAFVDAYNLRWAKEFINKYELGHFANRYASDGWCTYPLYKFDISRLEV